MSPRPRLDHVRRPELLEAAAAVIRQRGLENARVADVADMAGTSAPSVLYYFASKAELLKEALTSAEERFYDELALELEGIASAPERMHRIVATCAGEGDYDAALWMELWVRALSDPDLAATRAELDARWRAAISPTLDRLGLPSPGPAGVPGTARTGHSDAFRWLHGELSSVRRLDPEATW